MLACHRLGPTNDERPDQGFVHFHGDLVDELVKFVKLGDAGDLGRLSKESQDEEQRDEASLLHYF